MRLKRRKILRQMLGGMAGGSLILNNMLPKIAHAQESQGKRILVVLELSGGNDGLNTLVPYGNDTYYKYRPNIGIKENQVRKIDDYFGFNPGMSGFEKLYKEGMMAIVHGCGYEQPSFSHFTSMAYWHTAAPNSGERTGWVGRLGNAITEKISSPEIINIDSGQSLAVNAEGINPVVFDNPDSFLRKGLFQEQPLLDEIAKLGACKTDACQFLSDVATSANEATEIVRNAWNSYDKSIDYGIDPIDLNKIASLIAYGLDTPIYYTSFRNNAFDTHVQQSNLHQRMLTYASDAVSGFFEDMKRLHRENDVVMMVFSEFGRRVPENTSLGTDHGTANHVYVIGKSVKGGHYGDPPSLDDLDDGDNFQFTTDFRRVYATLIDDWMRFGESEKILRKKFEKLAIFA